MEVYDCKEGTGSYKNVSFTLCGTRGIGLSFKDIYNNTVANETGGCKPHHKFCVKSPRLDSICIPKHTECPIVDVRIDGEYAFEGQGQDPPIGFEKTSSLSYFQECGAQGGSSFYALFSKTLNKRPIIDLKMLRNKQCNDETNNFDTEWDRSHMILRKGFESKCFVYNPIAISFISKSFLLEKNLFSFNNLNITEQLGFFEDDFIENKWAHHSKPMPIFRPSCSHIVEEILDKDASNEEYLSSIEDIKVRSN